MAGTTGQFNGVLISPDWEYVLAVAFSDPIAGPHIDLLSKAMADYLADPKSVNDTNIEDWQNGEKSMWYNNPTKVLAQKTIVESFASFAEVNKENKKLKFAVIHSDGDELDDGPASIKLCVQRDRNVYHNMVIPSRPRNAKVVKHPDDDKKAILKWERPERGGEIVTSYTIILKHEASGTEETLQYPQPNVSYDLDAPPELQLDTLKNRTATYIVTIQAHFLKIDDKDHGLSEKHEIRFRFPFEKKSREDLESEED